VTFAGWLIGINGAFSAIGGVIVLIVAPNTREMARDGLPQGALLVTGFVVLTLGLLQLLLVYACSEGATRPASSRRSCSASRCCSASRWS
jgi:hypothetical protein